MTGGRGFTFVELCLALAVTGMVAIALTTLSLSTTQYWRETEQRQQLYVSSAQSSGMIAPLIESARGLGSVTTGENPGVFLWQTDTFGGTPDGQAQFAEMALIEYDPGTYSVYYYEVDSSPALLEELLAAVVLSADDLLNTDFIVLFKQQSWLKPRRTLLGPGRAVDDDREITRVNACKFSILSSGGLPAVQMNATLSRGGEKRTMNEIYTVRAPSRED